MYMNIYIRLNLETKLRQEKSMSGLVNMLLEEHYSHSPGGITGSVGTTHKNTIPIEEFAKETPSQTVAWADYEASPVKIDLSDEDLLPPTPYEISVTHLPGKIEMHSTPPAPNGFFGLAITDNPLALTCCTSSAARCPHWGWNIDYGHWVNKLTGEIKEA